MKKILSILLIAVILSAMLPVTQVDAAVKSAAAYLADGNKYLSLNKYQDAIKAFDAAIKLNSKYTEAYVGKGRSQYGLGSYADAVKSFDKAISINKKYSQAFYYKGLTLLELDKLPESLSSFNTAIALNPKYAEAYNEKGFALEWTEKYDDALKAYDTAIKLNSKLIDAYINKAELLLTQYKKYIDANAVIDAALKINANNHIALYYKAKVLQALNNHIEAIAFFDKAIKANAKIPNYYYSKGFSQYMAKKYADAIVSFNRAIELYPKGLTGNADYYYYRALAYRDLGQFNLSIGDMKKAIELHSNYIDNIIGTIESSKYSNNYLGMELALPKEWSSSSIDLSKLLEIYKVQGNIQLSDSYLPLMVSKYPAGSNTSSYPNLILMLVNVSAYPEIKTGADYLPFVLNLLSQQRAYKYDQNIVKTTLDSVSFDVINCDTEENGAAVHQKLYATVYRGYAVCFALTYMNNAELVELENILKGIKFIK